jgi:DNA (cytosine-5)-methyltransferase 1
LSYSLAKQIKQVIPEAKYVVDLFSGAGGLSLGFHWAGFVTGVASDFFGDALRTYAQNFPKTKTVLGDITQKKVLDEIISLSTCLPQVDIVMGGPPCQGFSTAGKRMIDDPRNALYKQFVKVVKELKPKVFLMENVEGLISINGGKTYEEIKKTFQNLGYQVEGRKLLAAEYGVPQLRKRVVIVGVRQKSDDLLFPKPILSKNNFVTVREAIGDLPSRPLVSVEDQVPYAKAAESDYQNFTRGELSAHSFLRTLKRVEMQRSNF